MDTLCSHRFARSFRRSGKDYTSSYHFASSDCQKRFDRKPNHLRHFASQISSGKIAYSKGELSYRLKFFLISVRLCNRKFPGSALTRKLRILEEIHSRRDPHVQLLLTNPKIISNRELMVRIPTYSRSITLHGLTLGKKNHQNEYLIQGNNFFKSKSRMNYFIQMEILTIFRIGSVLCNV